MAAGGRSVRGWPGGARLAVWAVAFALAAAPDPVTAEDLSGAWIRTSMSQVYRVADSWKRESCDAPPRNRYSSKRVTYRVSGDPSSRYEFSAGRRDGFGSHRCMSRNPEVSFRSYDPGSMTTRCATGPSSGTLEEETHTLRLTDPNHAVVTARYHYLAKIAGQVCEAWMVEKRAFERAEPVRVAKVGEPPAPRPEPKVDIAPKPKPVHAPRSQPRPRRRAQGRIEVDLGERDRIIGMAQGRGGVEWRRVGEVEAGGAWAMVLGLVSFALGLVAVAFVFRSRRRRSVHPPDEPIIYDLPGEDEALPGEDDGSRPVGLVKRCPVCGRSLPGDALFCPFDGTSLGAGVAANVTCPACGRTYPPGTEVCPEDGQRLVRVFFEAEVQRGPSTGVRQKICPTCGERYDADKSFCGRDGTPLIYYKGSGGPADQGGGG